MDGDKYKFSLKIFNCLFTMYVPWHTSIGLKTTCGSWFVPSTNTEEPPSLNCTDCVYSARSR